MFEATGEVGPQRLIRFDAMDASVIRDVRVPVRGHAGAGGESVMEACVCLVYTSDAADDRCWGAMVCGGLI